MPGRNISDLYLLILLFLWKLKNVYGKKMQSSVISPALTGTGDGFFFGTRNKKEFFLSLLASFQSEVSISLEADEIKSSIDQGSVDDSFRFIFPLGKEYWLRQISNAPEYFHTAIDRWIAHNPPGSERWYDLQVSAIRIINWIAGFHLFSDHSSINEKLLRRFFKTLFLHGSWFYIFSKSRFNSNIEKLSLLTALQFTGTLFLKSKKGGTWLRRSIKLIDTAILQDDPAIEPYSFANRIEFYTFSYILSEKNNISRSTEIKKKLHTMYYSLSNVEGEPEIERQVFRYTITEDIPMYEGLMTVGAILFNDPELKKRYPHFSEDVLWLLGAEGFEAFRNI